MLINYKVINKRYKCNKAMANFLIYKEHLPLLSVDNDDYYFADTDNLKVALKKMPFYLRMFNIFYKK
jgi:translation elongation factor P/translation initiation factor 5A